MYTFSHCLEASAVSIPVDGRREGEVCPEAAAASRWSEFVALRVGVATNVGGSVYIVERDDVKGPQKGRTLGPPWSRRQPKDCHSVVGLSWDLSWVVRQIICFCHELGGRGNTVIVRWVPGHKRVPGNEKGDELANRGCGCGCVCGCGLGCGQAERVRVRSVRIPEHSPG
jgi:hypothetical protein